MLPSSMESVCARRSGSATSTTTWPIWRPSWSRLRSARFRLIATDGVFLDGWHHRQSRRYLRLAERYQALVMVDECHAAGFLGKTGRGTPEHCGVEGRVDIITGLWEKPWEVAAAGIPPGGKRSWNCCDNVRGLICFPTASHPVSWRPL